LATVAYFIDSKEINIMNVQDVISAFSTIDENGNVTAFDFASFDELVSALVTERAKIRKESKDAIKAQKEATRESDAEAGKAYYNALAEGATFVYKTADGTMVEAKKIKTKSGTGSTAACELLNPPAGAKTTKRYPKFYQVVVPVETPNIADEVEGASSETAEEVVA
jgi:hypothetical protein